MKTNDADIFEESQRELANGVLKQATRDLRRFYNATAPVERELYSDAFCWVMSEDCSWAFSFQNVCRLLNLVPDVLRDELLGDLPLGAFGQWARRCQRTIRRFSMPLKRRVVSEPQGTASAAESLIPTW
jgi:hypothetical protein